MKVTLYPNIKTSAGGENKTLKDIINSIKAGQWATQVSDIRTIEDKAQRTKAKQKLPYFTGSGTFDQRNKQGLIAHSNRIIIDIDNIDSSDLGPTKKLLANDKYSECVFLSVSGNGLAVIVKIDGSKHEHSFDALKAYYIKTYNIAIDKSCRDVCRPRYVSHDPKLIYNETSETFLINGITKESIYNIVSTKIQRSPEGQRHNDLLKASILMGGFVAGGVFDDFEAENFLTEQIVHKYGEAWPDDTKAIKDGLINGKTKPLHYDTFEKFRAENPEYEAKIKNIYKIAHQINRAGRVFSSVDISQSAKEFEINPDKVEKIFKKIFAKHKEEFGIDNKPIIFKAEIYLKDKYDFLRNEVTQFNEFKLKNEAQYIKCNVDSVHRSMQHVGLKFGLDKLKSLLRSDFVPAYNPFVEYFENLPTHTDDKDYIKELANYVNTTDQEFFEVQFKKTLVRSIACSLYNEENRIVFVLVGEKQHTGKSTFIRFLNPFGIKYYTESPLRDTKDGEFSYAQNFIYNLEELSSLNNIEINKLKAIISKTMIKERKAYAEDAEEHPRRCNFWGSTNNGQFLTDTENTRWLCFTIESINWDYKKDIDINKVWAQAYKLYIDGYDHTMTPQESVHRDKENKNYELVDLEKELITRHYKPSDNIGGKFVTNSNIMDKISISPAASKLNIRAVGKAMIQLGFIKDLKKINGHTARGYWVEEVDFQDIGIEEDLPF